MSKIPNKIFLSHKSTDKALVRRFQSALEELGFVPWLDETAMPPFLTLGRGIYEGIAESCACVFFITANFRDEQYVKQEIDLAHELQLERGEDRFRIIPLVFGLETAVPGVVKRLTRYAVFEEELDAFAYLIKWLPVAVGTVHFRDDPRARGDSGP